MKSVVKNYLHRLQLALPAWAASTDDGGTLIIDAKITGNRFPAQETLIFDQKGNGLFIGTSMATGSPIWDVWGSGKDNLLSNKHIKIAITSDGTFTGVYGVDKEGNEIVLSPDSWNKKFTDQKVWDQQDLYDQNTGEHIPTRESEKKRLTTYPPPIIHRE